jgi:type VI secretion system protein ImpB
VIGGPSGRAARCEVAAERAAAQPRPVRFSRWRIGFGKLPLTNVFAVCAGAIMLARRKERRRLAGDRRGIMAKNSNSGQKFISRNRKPRVHITYEDPYDSEELVELPFVMGVMADLSGNASAVEKPDIENRKFLDTDMDNFDARMAAIEPAVTFKTPNKLGNEGGTQLSVNLKFTKFEDFEPAAVARQVPALAKLLAAREQLSNLLRYMDGKMAAEDTLKKLLADPQLMSALKQKLEQRPTTEEKPE